MDYAHSSLTLNNNVAYGHTISEEDVKAPGIKNKPQIVDQIAVDGDGYEQV